MTREDNRALEAVVDSKCQRLMRYGAGEREAGVELRDMYAMGRREGHHAGVVAGVILTSLSAVALAALAAAMWWWRWV